ncbi:FAD-dependent oxidoreductase [Gammaproteobacteria bacterium]|nr:FAD-dependent oxidoreductase [Gammaproteobacteria bacterium]
MKEIIETDILIAGGGIAGLWLLNRLKNKGFSAILLEPNSLGYGQTGVSQGIIHGGMKYALNGSLSPAAKAIAEMPSIWKNCLNGCGDINLSKVKILSDKQYLWSTNSLSSKLGKFLATLSLKSNIKNLKKGSFPKIFQNKNFKGQITALDEIVVDIFSLIKELSIPHMESIFKISYSKELNIKSQKVILTAGANNNTLNDNINMQKRPLHMVIVKHDHDIPIYAHCLGLSNLPRLTITSHKTNDNKWVWYLGGQIAEEGIKLNQKQQINVAKKELQDLFSWIDFSKAEYASFFVDRAEHLQSNGKKPDSCSILECDNIITAWPTKLVLAPKLANDILKKIKDSNIKPQKNNLNSLKHLEKPKIVTPIWDQLL